MYLTFWGAAKQVTGSMFLLEMESGFNILIDCGIDLERKEKKKKKYEYRIFPFEASQIHAVLLTHAHIDHSGFIPNLLREGFEGTIYTTRPTFHLANLLLQDMARIHQRRWKRFNRLPASEQKKLSSLADEWYLPRNVDEAMTHFHTVPFNKKLSLSDDVYVIFNPTGHLLGAANIIVDVKEKGGRKKIAFSGDIGRKNYPLLPDPQPLPEVDFLVCETTYGSRYHEKQAIAEKELYRIVHKACVERRGRLIIPAFSIGRTQALLYILNKLHHQGKLPAIKVFADSPLAYKSTQIHDQFIDLLNSDAKAFYEKQGSLFDFDNLHYVEDLKKSKALSNHAEPCIIISSSGMIQGGRVEHHVRSNLENPYATILMIGYATEGTIGYQLRNGIKSLRIKNKEIPVLAHIEITDVFSGHGDLDDLQWFVNSQDTNTLKQIFLVHGETSAMENFKKILEEKGYPGIVIPQKGEQFQL